MRARLPALASALLLLVAAGVACDTELESVPAGALALVGNEVIWPEALEARRAELGAYGQQRFGQEGGRLALLEAAITQKLLVLEAKRVGLARDPRVQWAQTEELARLQLAAELERRVPEQSVAEDVAALRAYYDAHIEQFTEPERRGAEMIPFDTVDDAEKTIALLASGELTWEGAGEATTTATIPRDDERFPLFHRQLFDPALQVGQVIPVPIYAQLRFNVARVHELVPATPKSFDDPRVRAELVEAVRAPRLEKARAELMAELAERYPVVIP